MLDKVCGAGRHRDLRVQAGTSFAAMAICSEMARIATCSPSDAGWQGPEADCKKRLLQAWGVF
jgi:hypothetical protein